MYIYGKNVLKEMLNNKNMIKEIYLSQSFSDKEILNNLGDIKINYLTIKELDKLVEGNHQGVVVKIKEFKMHNLEDVVDNIEEKYPILLILDHLEDPHNLGAIIRTSEALGVDGIIIPKRRSVSVNATVMKTSAGALNYVKLIEVSNLVQAINDLKKKGYWIIGADMDGTEAGMLDYKMPIALVIGNEGTGISDLVKKKCDFIATIKMKGQINSLNASVATGIMINTVIEQRK